MPLFLTEYVTTLLLVIGAILLLAGLVLNVVPLLKTYRLPIQVIGIVIFAYGVYLQGGVAVEQKYKLQVAELEKKLKDAEVAAQKVNTKIVTEVVTKREIVKEKGQDVIRYVDREVVKYDNTCPMPDVVIKAHNAAAKNEKVNDLIVQEPAINITEHDKATQKSSTTNLILPKK